jgi:hypothetical protein
MNKVREHVATLSDEVKRQLIENFEAFERDGFIGDEPLREHAREVMTMLGTDQAVVVWMNMLAFECYRHFAKLSENGKPHTC